MEGPLEGFAGGKGREMGGPTVLHISVGPLVTLWAVGFALCFCMCCGLWWPTLQSVLLTM